MSSPTRIGVLLCNLGTPDAPTAGALRPFLREFLSDPRVVELPRLQWLPVLYGFILPFRPRKSAQLYQKIWTEDGSPLLLFSERLRAGVGQLLGEMDFRGPDAEFVPAPARRGQVPALPVELGMRYGQPSIGSALRRLRDGGCDRILVLPLYPQYSATTTGSTFDAVWEELRRWRVVPDLRTVSEYPEEGAYIEALASSIRELWSREGEPETLLLSFHGIPRRYHESGDPYPDRCQATARLLKARLGIEAERCQVSFQSVFGKEQWVQPATDATVRRLAESGVRTLDVVCPGFSVDCLETLEEIDEQNREIFREHGGSRFRYIPCLNDREDHIEMLARLIRRNLAGWIPSESAADCSVGRS